MSAIVKGKRQKSDDEQGTTLLEPASGQDRHYAGQATSLLHNANMAFGEAISYVRGIEDHELRNLTLLSLRQTLNALDVKLQRVESPE